MRTAWNKKHCTIERETQHFLTYGNSHRERIVNCFVLVPCGSTEINLRECCHVLHGRFIITYCFSGLNKIVTATCTCQYRAVMLYCLPSKLNVRLRRAASSSSWFPSFSSFGYSHTFWFFNPHTKQKKKIIILIQRKIIHSSFFFPISFSPKGRQSGARAIVSWNISQ